jgi:hypothetical protein
MCSACREYKTRSFYVRETQKGVALVVVVKLLSTLQLSVTALIATL